MSDIKKGDIVGRKSYKSDILFFITRIIDTKEGQIAILKGVIERIEADSPIEDLEVIDEKRIENTLKKFDERLDRKVKNTKQTEDDSVYNMGILTNNLRTKEKFITGKILHLDGDKKYSEKSYRYYKKLGLRAVVKNIPEHKQSKSIYQLLSIYNPDIVVITGHDRNDTSRYRI